MEPFIMLIIIVVLIGISCWIVEAKILPLPIGEPWNWIVRAIFWCAVILILWKYVLPLLRAVV